MSDDFFDSDKAARATTGMWRALGDLIANAIPALVSEGQPAKAVYWATCAEACYWKATGEADTHDVKDVLCGKPVENDTGGQND